MIVRSAGLTASGFSAGLKICARILLAVTISACHPAPTPAITPPASQSSPLTRLGHDIDDILAAPALAQSFWGVLVKSLDRDETWYSLNAGKLMMPASTIKIVTLAAAAEKLGWDYTYETRLLALGAIDGGSLNGDLLVVGSGDPSIDDWDGAATRLFGSWAETLKSKGVSAINGRIIGDDNAFDDDGLGFGWSWDDLGAGFAAPIGALQFNENSVQLTIAPGAVVGAAATVTVAQAGSDLVVRNAITTGGANTTTAIQRRRLAGTTRLELRGSIPLAAMPIVQTVSVDNPTLFFVTSLRNVFVADGIDVRGPAVDIDDLDVAPSQAGGLPLVTYRSPPLSMLATTLMKLSQNQFAETFLKTMGARAGTATAEGGRAAVRSILQGWNISPDGLIQVDGSGLSRYNYVTPEALVAVLTHVVGDERLRRPFEAALPIAGRDGTLETRMKGTPAESNARAKTGSLTGVRAMAGYVQTADGERLVFAILANNFDGPPNAITQAEDAIVVRLAKFSR